MRNKNAAGGTAAQLGQPESTKQPYSDTASIVNKWRDTFGEPVPSALLEKASDLYGVDAVGQAIEDLSHSDSAGQYLASEPLMLALIRSRYQRSILTAGGFRG